MSEEKKTLTAEQEAKIPEFRKKWIDIGHDTSESNRAAAELAMAKCYESASLPVPRTVIWFKSFASGAVAAAYLSKSGITANTPNLVENCNEAARRFIDGERQISIGGVTISESDVQSMLETACYGQHDASWLGFYNFFEEQVGVDAAPLHGLMEMARHGSWWWPFDEAVILTEKPCDIRLDDRMRLHSTTGPSVTYRDGFKVYCYHGIQVTSDIIENPDSITPARIDGETNAEMRRVLLERFGLERYLKSGGATMIQEDSFGKLWKKAVPGDDPVVMVEVLNSTPEPDGTTKTYLLPVPPETRTAKAAVAWTFNLEEAEYNPEVQT
jgi:hypothetical protein